MNPNSSSVLFLGSRLAGVICLAVVLSGCGERPPQDSLVGTFELNVTPELEAAYRAAHPKDGAVMWGGPYWSSVRPLPHTIQLRRDGRLSWTGNLTWDAYSGFDDSKDQGQGSWRRQPGGELKMFFETGHPCSYEDDVTVTASVEQDELILRFSGVERQLSGGVKHPYKRR